MKRALFGVLAVAAVTAGAAAAEPAPAMFRGDAAHAGAYVGPAPHGLNSLWRYRTGGAIVGSPTPAGDAIYVGSADGFVYALSKADGALRWRAKTGGEVNSSPAVAGGLVYALSQDGALYALDRATGARRWTFVTQGEHRYTKPGVDGMQPGAETMPDPWDVYLSSPAVADGLVVFGSGDGNVYALDAATGARRWAFQTGDVVHASPAIADGVVFVGSFDGRFYALELATGRKLWAFDGGRDDAHHLMTGFPGSAAVAGGRVFVGGRDGHVYALDARTGRRLWAHATDGAWVVASPAVRDGVVYVPTSDSERFLALDAETGRSLFELPTQIYAFSSPALVGGHAYFGGFDGRLHDVDLTKHAYAEAFAAPGLAANGSKWLKADGRIDGEKVWTGPTLDAAVVGIRERLFSLGSMLSSPAVADGVVYVASVDGTVYALH